MPIITFRWFTVEDATSCKKCLVLSGYVWQFKDEMPSMLTHPQFGIVYNVAADQSLAHGLGVHYCRCRVITEIDDSDLTMDMDTAVDQANTLNNTLNSTLSSIQQFTALLGGAR